MADNEKKLSYDEYINLLEILKNRFENNMNRHSNIKWTELQEKLKDSTNKLWSLYEMERTGGEPDVIDYDKNADEFIFYDCSKETPSGRRNLCYDNEALKSRKQHKPTNSAINMATSMGTQILNEEQYKYLQKLGEFDIKTSSWIKTDEDIRKLGGALFCDRRYSHIFVYHNGAESYYSSRGFRTMLKV